MKRRTQSKSEINYFYLIERLNFTYLQDQHPFPNGQFSWGAHDYQVPPPENAFFDQGGLPFSQFDNYLNMGYAPQGGFFPDPNIPIMPQQSYNQFDNLMGADNQMYYPQENGPMFDPSGAYNLPLYDVQDGLQQFNQFQPALQNNFMNYPQFPHQNGFELPPSTDDFSWPYGTHNMYNYDQSKYNMYNYDQIKYTDIQEDAQKLS